MTEPLGQSGGPSSAGHQSDSALHPEALEAWRVNDVGHYDVPPYYDSRSCPACLMARIEELERQR